MSTPEEHAQFKARMAIFQTRASLYADSRMAEVRSRLGEVYKPGDVVLEHFLALHQLEIVRAWMEGNLHGIIYVREGK